MTEQNSSSYQLEDILNIFVNGHPLKDNPHFKLFIDTILRESYSHFNDGSKLPLMFENAFDFFSEGEIPKLRIHNNKGFSVQSNSTVIQAHTKDIKFLLDSIREYLNERNYKTKLIINPIFYCFRDSENKLVELKPGTEGTNRESFIHIEISKVTDEEVEKLTREIEDIMEAVQHAVEDFQPMCQKLKDLNQKFKKGQLNSPGDPNFSLYEVITFLDWLRDDTFVFLGYREYKMIDREGVSYVQVVSNSGKGVMRDDRQSACFEAKKVESFPDKVRERIQLKTPLIIDKTHYKSSVHRRAHMDFIEVREFNGDGKAVRWHRFIGLFTRKALFQHAKEIPLLSSKLDNLIETKQIVAGSSMHREMLIVFNSLPKEVLFFTSTEELDNLMQLIISAYREQAIRLYLRSSFTGGAISIIVALPEKYFGSNNSSKIADFFQESLGAESIQYYQKRSHPGFWEIFFFLSFEESKNMPVLSKQVMEEKVIKIVKDWDENLIHYIEKEIDDRHIADTYIQDYVSIFPDEYESVYPVQSAFEDIKKIDLFFQTGENQYEFLHPDETFGVAENETLLKIYTKEKISLTSIMPVLENLGLNVIDESAFHLIHKKGDVHLQIFAVTDQDSKVLDRSITSGNLEEALKKVIEGQFENGILNALVVKAGLNYLQVNLLRAYYNYYFQIERVFARKTVASIILKYAHIFKLFFHFFELKFDPQYESDRRTEEILEVQDKIIDLIKEVTDINEDRVLKAFNNLIDSTVRTNYFARSKEDNFLISLKIESRKVLKMPEPKPLYEIYVYAALMEGIHLRGGMIARGGLRYSDRVDDYRTEVLALMKTQMTKNAVIVPVGSKGGFIIRPNGAQITREFIKEQYQLFISGLLEVTDNIVNGQVVHPENVLHYDGEDPYLVVAADKGTAHLSDAANEMSERYRFWLGDAFASGGSNGYDHKKVGITAKGAWECVKRHFRELDKNIQEEEFSVVGIGDMGGDVFGNGMLLSRKILLKAAFNHIHIFIDPTPDAESSYIERERLFNTPGLMWSDYKADLISKGGGVFSRNEKAIRLTTEIKELLNIEQNELSGNDLIKSILTANVELLWNGGIGTYVKASSETHEQVGDKSNDAVRVNADELRVKVVGEGGNLGLTQLARVEFAYEGGLINTDAIDNSAGVDMSDHEVNFKILFNALKEEGLIKSEEERNDLLEELTDELTYTILKDNYLQSMAISIDRLRSGTNLDRFKELIDDLSTEGLLDVKTEYMPNDKDINAYKTEGKSFLRPQLSVLMGYEKMRAYNEILNSEIPDLKFCEQYFISYFPDKIYTSFGKNILKHRLKREIIATVITNNIINQGGVNIFYELKRDTSHDYSDIAGAYIFVEEVLDIPSIRKALYLMDYEIPAFAQYGKLRWIEKEIRLIVSWNLTLKQYLIPDEEDIEELKTKVWAFQDELQLSMSDEEKEYYRQRLESDVPAGLPEELVKKVLAVENLQRVFIYLPLAEGYNRGLMECHKVTVEIDQKLRIKEIMDQLHLVQSVTIWDQITLNYLMTEFYMAEYYIAKKVFADHDGSVQHLFDERKSRFDHYNHWIERLKEEKAVNYEPFMVILKFIWNLTD